MQADRYQKSNPNLKINLDIHDRADAPTVQFKLVDGTEVSWGTMDASGMEYRLQSQVSHAI